MSHIPNKFDETYYDSKYFAEKDGKSFERPDGSTGHWSYANPEGEWLGCKPITQAWKDIFHPRNALDVGCGRGTFVGYMRDIGIKAVGFDFSEWAVKNPYRRCNSSWITKCDATQKWSYNDRKFDLVVTLDLMEHIYMEDIDSVINEMYRVTDKFIFLQIATIDDSHNNDFLKDGYIINKGCSVPVELQGCAVAGHVTVKRKQFWTEKLNREGWKIREDLVDEFIRRVPSNVIQNWVLNTLIVLERIK